MFYALLIVGAIAISMAATLKTMAEDEMIPPPEWVNPVREMEDVTAMLVMKMLEYSEQPSINNQGYVGVDRRRPANNE